MEQTTALFILVGGLVGAIALAVLLVSLLFRRVVSTNEVHIVQSAKKTTSYGKDTGHGNTYYQWPSWIPLIGVTRITLPVSVFDLDLIAYEAYDKGRLPFVVDVKAFFRISHSDIAAQRVASFEELHEQLKAVVQGAVRTILASNEIEEIMQGRSKFGQEFTNEVNEQLSQWGVDTVKNIELMDIRDSSSSHVIKNIMEKKKSHIEMESRQEVAKNKRAAEIAEIDATRDVSLQKQEAEQQVGLRTTETDRTIEIARQEALQKVKEQERATKEKEMAVLQVSEVRTAEIHKQKVVIEAQQNKEMTVIIAEGKLEAQKKEAEAVQVQGEAKANAEKAMQLAPVEAQITLAKEIGQNESYQKYLVTIRQVEANEHIGVEQAKALTQADIKIIANAGKPAEGVSSARDLFSSGGGQQIGAMLEGLAQTPTGEKLLSKVGLGGNA